jgi:putative FmdB family regulatory protein
MPIYEFYCEDCNTIFNFFSNRVNTEKRPVCPKCNKRTLERLVSRFSVIKGAKEDADGMPDIDAKKLEQAMSLVERESGRLEKGDPRDIASVMSRVFDTAGMRPGPGMEQVLRRLESGEDPDKLESELGDSMTEDDLVDMFPRPVSRRRGSPPAQDETLYYL